MHPPIFTQWYLVFALSAFFDDFKPSQFNLLIQICMPLNPSARDWINLSSPKHRPVFCCCFDSGTREITLRIQKERYPMETYTQRSILDSKSDFPCTRIERTISSLGLKCKQKHNLLLGVAYPFKTLKEIRIILSTRNTNRDKVYQRLQMICS